MAYRSQLPLNRVLYPLYTPCIPPGLNTPATGFALPMAGLGPSYGFWKPHAIKGGHWHGSRDVPALSRPPPFCGLLSSAFPPTFPAVQERNPLRDSHSAFPKRTTKMSQNCHPIVNNFRAFCLPYLRRLVIRPLRTKSYRQDNHLVEKQITLCPPLR